jgi:hypothetical protein
MYICVFVCIYIYIYIFINTPTCVAPEGPKEREAENGSQGVVKEAHCSPSHVDWSTPSKYTCASEREDRGDEVV